jgi:hypothetical protein
VVLKAITHGASGDSKQQEDRVVRWGIGREKERMKGSDIGKGAGHHR